MILQIVETGFPAHSLTATHLLSFTCICFEEKSILCTVYCFTSLHYWAIIVKVSGTSGILIYLTWQETWGLRVRGGSQKQQQPSLGVCPPITTAGEGAGPTNKWDGAVVPIRNTIILPYIGQDQMYISEEAGKLTTLDRLKKWMDGPEQDLQHPIYPALLMWTQSVLPEVLAASPEVSQTDTSLPYQARFLCSSGSYRFLWYWYYWTTKKDWFIVMESKARFFCPFCWYTLTKSVLLLSTTLLYIHYESGAEVFIWIDKKLSTNLLYIHYGSGADFVFCFFLNKNSAALSCTYI